MEFNRSVDISTLPRANISRSVFDRSRSLFTTANAGSLFPVFYDDVLPGDSFEINTSFVARLQTLIAPIMSSVYVDIYFFYVPSRLVWNHWEEFMGENNTSYWTQPASYTEPAVPLRSSVGSYEYQFSPKSIADYMGYPTQTTFYHNPSVLPFRMYCLCWNDYFRDQNVQEPVLIDLGDSSSNVGTISDKDLWSAKLNYAQFGMTYCLPANKYHDLFTSALPSPQKGPDVSIPIGGISPVIGFKDTWSDTILKGGTISTSNSSASRTTINPIIMKTFTGNTGTSLNSISTGQDVVINSSGQVSRNPNTSITTNTNHPVFANLGVDLGDNVSATINDLRLAFATQRYYEALARGGSRYCELLSSIFGVDSPDARLQRPEYLGGSHAVLNVEQVTNTNGDGSAPLGDTGAYSLTFDSEFNVKKSFVEHGAILGLCAIRYPHDYQQGLPKCFAKKTKFDYYWPQFANIGEVGIKSSELFVDGTSADDNIFGYQEAWYEYRYPTYTNVTSEMRSNYTTPLDIWHLADDYSTRPTLSGSWMMEDKANLDRVLSVKSSVADQCLLNFWFDVKATRPLPTYSVPGGLDLR